MLDWKKVSEELPKQGDQCLLRGENGSMQGPIHWHEESGAWLDLFGPMATPEAGVTIPPDTPGLTHWAVVNSPDDDEEETK